MKRGAQAAAVTVVTLVALVLVALTLPIGFRVAGKVVDAIRGDLPAAQPVPVHTADLGGAGRAPSSVR